MNNGIYFCFETMSSNETITTEVNRQIYLNLFQLEMELNEME